VSIIIITQVEENLGALPLLKAWTPELEKRVRDILGNDPEVIIDFRMWKPAKQRRDEALV
jgi:hypothetical protein